LMKVSKSALLEIFSLTFGEKGMKVKIVITKK
jgi:hypothetical protein